MPDGVIARIQWMNIESLLGGRAGTVVAAGSKRAAEKLLKSGQSLTKKEMDDILKKLPDAKGSVAKAGENPKQTGERLAKADRARRKKEDIDTAKAATKGESPTATAAAEKAAKPTTTRTGETYRKTPVFKRPADSNIKPGADVIKPKTSAAARAAAKKRNVKKRVKQVAAGTAIAGALGTAAVLTKKDKPPEMPAGWKKPMPRTTPPPSAEKKSDPKPKKKPETDTKKPTTVNTGPPPDPKPKEKDRLTNKEIARQNDLLAKLRRDETQQSGLQTVVWKGNTYGGGMKSVGDSKKLLKDINEYNKGKEKPEDPVKRVVKKIKRKITSKKGGGRVSSRPAKVMKQYAHGGSVRKPKRIK